MQSLLVVASIAGTLVSAAGQFSAGISANREAKANARQMDIAATQERAAAQRSAIEERRKAGIAASDAQAAAAASGGGASDPSVIKTVTDLVGEGEYRALSDIYTGEQSARNYEAGADASRYRGNAAARAGRIGAFGTLLKGASTLYDNYGGGTGTTTKAKI